MLICVLVEKCLKVMSPDLKTAGLLKFKAHQSSSPKISWKLNKNTMRWIIPLIFPVQPKCNVTFFGTLCWDQKCYFSISLLLLKARNYSKTLYLQQCKLFTLLLTSLNEQSFISVWKCTEHQLGNHSIPQRAEETVLLTQTAHIDSNCTHTHTHFKCHFFTALVKILIFSCCI